MGKYWAQSVRLRGRWERATLAGAVAAGFIAATVLFSASFTATAFASEKYVVKRGDTLGAIAIRNKTTVKELAKINKIKNVNLIYIGQVLTIPGKAKPAPTTTTTTKPKASPSNKPSGSGSVKSFRNLPAFKANPDRLKYDKYFNKWADANGIPRDLVKATCYMESGWNNKAVSYAGARGIGQLMPRTAVFIREELIGRPDLTEKRAEDNIRMSARYLRYLMKLNNGDQKKALASYYQGFSSVKKYGQRANTKHYVKTISNLRKYFD